MNERSKKNIFLMNESLSEFAKLKQCGKKWAGVISINKSANVTRNF